MDDNVELKPEEEISEEVHNMLRKPKVTPHPETRRLCGDVPAELFTDFKIEAIKRGLTMAQAIEQAAKLWLQKQREDDERLMARAEEEARQMVQEEASNE